MHPFSGEAACLHFVTRVSPDSDPLYSASPNNCHFFTVAYGELLSSATLHDADKRWLEAMFGLECGALSGDGSSASSSVSDYDCAAVTWDPVARWEALADLLLEPEPEERSEQKDARSAPKTPRRGCQVWRSRAHVEPPLDAHVPKKEEDVTAAMKGFPRSPSGVMDDITGGWSVPGMVELGMEELII